MFGNQNEAPQNGLSWDNVCNNMTDQLEEESTCYKPRKTNLPLHFLSPIPFKYYFAAFFPSPKRISKPAKSASQKQWKSWALSFT